MFVCEIGFSLVVCAIIMRIARKLIQVSSTGLVMYVEGIPDSLDMYFVVIVNGSLCHFFSFLFHLAFCITFYFTVLRVLGYQVIRHS